MGQALSWLPGICRSDLYNCLPSEFTGETDILTACSQRKEEATIRGLDLLVGRGRVQMEAREAIVAESLMGQVAAGNREPPLGKS